jgi:hypothetical protein
MRIKNLGAFLTALSVITIGQAADTTYDPATGEITIPEVEVNGKVEFVNVKLKANSDGTLSVVSSEAPKASSAPTTYDPATDTVTIPSVTVNGKVEYENVELGINSDGTLSVLSTETPTPSYSDNIQDESYQTELESILSAASYNWGVPVGNISGYNVQYRRFAIGSDYIYQILGTSSTDGSQLGFACICANVNTVKTWRGVSNSACDAANPNTPLKLDDPVMGVYKVYNVPLPAGACCKSAPRVGTTFIPGLPNCS